MNKLNKIIIIKFIIIIMDRNNSPKPPRIGFVGGLDVGKTTLIYRMANNTFL